MLRFAKIASRFDPDQLCCNHPNIVGPKGAKLTQSQQQVLNSKLIYLPTLKNISICFF